VHGAGTGRTAEGETKICDYAFDLVEFGEMGSVDGFVAEDAVDGEVACRACIFGETMQGPCRYCGGVGA